MHGPVIGGTGHESQPAGAKESVLFEHGAVFYRQLLPMKKSAFTLIELLVVIAIIAILASLALPALTKSIEGARAADDLSRLKQLGIGMTNYLNENEDDMFPQIPGTDGPWPSLLHKYVPEWKTFQSPFDTRSAASAAPYPVSYGVNNNVYGVNTSKLTAPSELILLGPVNSNPALGKVTFTGTSLGNVNLVPGSGNGIYAKGKMLNVLFADSHVSAMNYLLFQDRGSQAGLRRWTPSPPDI